jgi:hypothetical protein
MLNKILEIGVENPVVCGILVKEEKLLMYQMHLADPGVYAMT